MSRDDEKPMDEVRAELVSDVTPSDDQRSDDQILDDCLMALDLRPGSGVRVSVEEGCVTLTGTVDSAAESEQAEKAVQRLSCVRGLTNLITVAGQIEELEEWFDDHSTHESRASGRRRKKSGTEWIPAVRPRSDTRFDRRPRRP